MNVNWRKLLRTESGLQLVVATLLFILWANGSFQLAKAEGVPQILQRAGMLILVGGGTIAYLAMTHLANAKQETRLADVGELLKTMSSEDLYPGVRMMAREVEGHSHLVARTVAVTGEGSAMTKQMRQWQREREERFAATIAEIVAAGHWRLDRDDYRDFLLPWKRFTQLPRIVREPVESIEKATA